jgi:hypothetical protein
MLRTNLLLVVTASVLSSCGGSTPTAPEDSATKIVAIGPQVLRIVYQSPCTQLGQGVLPLVYTRVSVYMSSNEWVATAASAAAGDIQVRFRQSSQSVIAGSMPVAGTIAGTGRASIRVKRRSHELQHLPHRHCERSGRSSLASTR